MRTIVLMLCLALLGATANTAFAQDNSKQKPSAEEMATKRTAKLTELLTLSADQQKQVYKLMLDHSQKREELRNTRLTEDERRSNMKELRMAFDKELKALLNADQQQKYTAHKEEMKKSKGHHGHKGHHNGQKPAPKK